MHSNSYTIIFTSLITIILGLFVSVAAGTLKGIQDLNIENDSKKNILISLGFKENPKTPWTASSIQKLFDENVRSFFLDESGDIVSGSKLKDDNEVGLNYLPIFSYQKNGIVSGYAIPISGKGLWSTLYGYFAIDPDGITAKGITFYSHKETPGLGGEVDKPWFQKNFIGKKFVNEKGSLIGIKVVKGKADPENSYEVDGISGATITSKGVEKFLLKDLKKYEPFFSKIRNNNI
mgnify:CR=1 FL=1